MLKKQFLKSKPISKVTFIQSETTQAETVIWWKISIVG